MDSRQMDNKRLVVRVAGFDVRLDVLYEPATHMWIDLAPDGTVRVGLDSLEVHSCGTVAALGMVEEGCSLRRGEPIGSLEAEKFVGSLRSPLSGVVTAVNEKLLERPALLDHDPYGSWMVELRPSEFAAETATFVSGDAAIAEWFAGEVAEYRAKGVLAE